MSFHEGQSSSWVREPNNMKVSPFKNFSQRYCYDRFVVNDDDFGAAIIAQVVVAKVSRID
jgi:hypothetical protein